MKVNRNNTTMFSMKSKIFRQIVQKVGKVSGSLVNKTTHLKETISDSARFGYEQVRTKKCVWCKGEFPIAKLYQIEAGAYLVCSTCLHGLGAACWRVIGETYEPPENKIVSAMLARVTVDKKQHPNTWNDFIVELKITKMELFPNDTN